MKFFLYTIFFSIVFSKGIAIGQSLKVIYSFDEYKKSIVLNPKNRLIDITKEIPEVVLDLKYSTKNNFTKTKLYRNASTTYLRQEVAIALGKASDELKLLGLGLKIFDAYRPYSATKQMWTLIQDERYVANPKFGSGHNKGIAVDLTLINLTNKEELNMGTGFDNFTDSAHHSFTKNLPQEIITNRTRLLTTMEKYGFKRLETEWWHYSFQSKEGYDVMDIDFKKLSKKIK